MDYKYINQLLERYWNGETTLEEEEILRAFFSQKDIPAELLPYQALFAYGQTEKKANVLGDDFDERILSIIEERKPVKARIIPLGQQLKPLFKAAAVVAIFLTLGNAMQVPFNDNEGYSVPESIHPHSGASVAMGDSAVIDSLQQSNLEPATPPTAGSIIK